MKKNHGGAFFVGAVAVWCGGCGAAGFTLAEGGAEPADASAEQRSDGPATPSDDGGNGSSDAPASVQPDARGDESPQVTNSGDCVDGECGNDRCSELTPGGYRTCVGTVTQVTSCSIPAVGCCSSAMCTGDGGNSGKCVAGPASPACGPSTVVGNVCAYDSCRTHQDCAALGPRAICVPATGFGHKAAYCMPAGCRVDSDCKEEPGGACLTVSDPCCARERVAGLYCVYRNRCRQKSDCAAAEYCMIDGARTRCVAGAPSCGIAP